MRGDCKRAILFFFLFVSLFSRLPLSTNVGGCAQLNTSDTYTLTADVTGQATTCFNITAENITLNLQGHDVNGTNASNIYGVFSNKLNTSILNGKINAFQDGIFLNASRNSLIQNITANTTATSGIAIRLDDGTNGTQVINASTYSISGQGIALFRGSNWNTVSNSTGTSTQSRAIFISSSHNNTLNNSKGLAPGGYGISLSGAVDNNITDSNGTSSSSYGISLESSSNQNRIIDTRAASATSNGAVLSSSSNNNFTRNNISASANAIYGVYISSSASTSNFFQGNRFTGDTAVYNSGNSNTFLGNTFIGAGQRIYIMQNDGDNNNFTANDFQTSDRGISFKTGGDFNIFSYNTLLSGSHTSYTYVGLFLQGNSNNATYNNGTGIAIDGSDNLVKNNKIQGDGTYSRPPDGIIPTGNYNTIANNTIFANQSETTWILHITGSRNNISGNVVQANGSKTAMNLTGANNSIHSNNLTAVSGNGIYLTGRENNLTSNNATTTSNTAIYLEGTAFNNLTWNRGTANGASAGIYLSSSENNTLADNTGSSVSDYAIRLITSNYNNFTRNNATSSSSFALHFRISIGNNVTGGRISSSTGRAALNISDTNNSIFRNLTINSSTTCINVSSTSWNNSFFYNELYNCTTYIENYNTNNTFNLSFDNTTFGGNFYDNIYNLTAYDLDRDGFADFGVQYPFNLSSKWLGLGADWGPIMGASYNFPNQTLQPGIPEIETNISVNLEGNYSATIYIDGVPSATNITYHHGELPAGMDSTGLLLLLHMNEEGARDGTRLVDSSGLGNHANITTDSPGQASMTRSGRLGRSIFFDGTDDLARVAHQSYFNVGNLTISAWVKLNNTPGSQQRIIAKDNAADGTSPLYDLIVGPSGQIITEAKIEGFTQTLYSSASVPVGAWTHLAATYNGATFTLYKDGEAINSTSVAGAISSPAANVDIGIGNQVGRNRSFSGLIDELALWNRSLSPAEMSTLYKKGRGIIQLKANASRGIHTYSVRVDGDLANITLANQTWESNATQISACANLSIQGMTYYLNTSVSSWAGATCFNITAENITVDLQGRIINGTNQSGSTGIYSNQKNTTVKNGIIDNFATGIYFNGAFNGTVLNNSVLVTANGGNAVYLSSAPGNSLVNNTLYSVNASALYITSSNYLVLLNNSARTVSPINALASTAIHILNPFRSNLTGNIANSSSGMGIYLQYSTACDGNRLENNTAESLYTADFSVLYGSGIYIYGCNGTAMFNNTARAAKNIGLQVATVENSTFSNNTLSSYSSSSLNGLRVTDASRWNNFTGNLISSDTPTTNQQALQLTDSAVSNYFLANRIYSISGPAGYVARETHYNVFENNTFSSNASLGLHISFTRPGNAGTLYRINVTGGSINSNNSAALLINNTNYTIIRNVTISSPTVCINITSGSSNNSLFYNYLYNCTTYVDNGNETNVFNTTSGAIAQGNFYSNIRGLQIYDSDADNYGDSGAQYPFNASISNWTGLGADWGPIGATSGLGCKNLNTVGITYNLSAHQTGVSTTCFNVTAENVTLNMQGRIINGTNISTIYGVYSNQKNTTVKNGIIDNFGTGIYFDLASNGTIQNNTVLTSTTSGAAINLNNADSISVINNTAIASGAASNAITLSRSNFSTILNNTALISRSVGETAGAIFLISGAGNNFTRNLANYTANSNTGPGIYLWGSGYCERNSLIWNTGYGGGANGLGAGDITSCNGTIVINNTFYGFGSTQRGFTDIGGNNTFEGNNFTSEGAEALFIILSDPSPSNYTNNRISSWTQYGIRQSGARVGSRFVNNIVYAGQSAVYFPVSGPSYFIFENNSFYSNASNAIYLKYAINFNITGGVAISNYSGGIYMESVNSSILRNITISSPTTCLNITSSSVNNSAFYNYLSGCTVYVDNGNQTSLFNTTFNSTPQGNFYSNIRALAILDSDNDNYGDSGTAYPINFSNAGTNWTGLGYDWGPIGAAVSGYGLISCGNLTVAGGQYHLRTNVSGWAGATCFNVTAENVTLDMRGNFVNGTNSSQTIGFYSNKLNTTIKNGLIDRFNYSIFLDSAKNSSITNMTALTYSPGGAAIYISDSNGTRLSNSTAITLSDSIGIWVSSSHNMTIAYNNATTLAFGAVPIGFDYINSHDGNITGNNATSNQYYGFLVIQSDRNIFARNIGATHSTAISSGYPAFQLRTATYNILTQNNATASSGGQGFAMETGTNWNNITYNIFYSLNQKALSIAGSANSNNRFIANNITSGSSNAVSMGTFSFNLLENNTIRSASGIAFMTGSSRNNVTGGLISSSYNTSVHISGSSFWIFRNVTINSSTACINITSSSENNSFFYNELHNCSIYIENQNTNNTFNTTSVTTAQGNLYPNILNVSISDTDSDNYGNAGPDYPYNASHSAGKWLGLGADWGPIGAEIPGKANIIVTTNVTTIILPSLAYGSTAVLFYNLTANNTANKSAYSVLAFTDAPVGWNSSTTNLSRISANTSNSTVMNLTVPVGTTPGIYYAYARVNWTNPDGTPGGNTSASILEIDIRGNPQIVMPADFSVSVSPNSTASSIIVVNSTGNDNAYGVNLTCRGTYCTTFNITFNESWFNITGGTEKRVNISLRALAGQDFGAYPVILNATSSNVSDSTVMTITVGQDYNWTVSRSSVNMSAPVSSTGITSIIIYNNGNQELSLLFNISGNATDVFSFSPASATLPRLSNYTLNLTYTAPASVSSFYGSFRINETLNDTVYILPLEFRAFSGVLNISPNATVKQGNITAGGRIYINATVFSGSAYINENVTFTVQVNGTSCPVSAYANFTAQNRWEINCTAPTANDGVWHNLTVVANYSTLNLQIENTTQESIHYGDTTPPRVAGSRINVSGSTARFQLNVTDNVQVVNVTAYLHQNMTNYTFNKTSGSTYELNITGLQVNDYDVSYWYNDSSNNSNSSTDYFEIWSDAGFSGQILNSSSQPVSADFKLYRNGTSRLLQNFSANATGHYSATIHSRKYDVNIYSSQMSANITAYNLTLSSHSGSISFDRVNPRETNLVSGVNGIGMRTNITANATILISYDASVLASSEDYLKIHRCGNWNFSSKSCQGVWTQLASSVDKVLDIVSANTTSLSDDDREVAYVLGESQPTSGQPDISLTSPDVLTVQHNKSGSAEISVISSGTGTALGVNVVCASGTICGMQGTAMAPTQFASIQQGSVETVRINISIPYAFPPATYAGIITAYGDGIANKSVQLQVTVPSNYTWTVNQTFFNASVGTGETTIGYAGFRSLGNANFSLQFSSNDTYGFANESAITLVANASARTVKIMSNATGSGNRTIGITASNASASPASILLNISLNSVNFSILVSSPSQSSPVQSVISGTTINITANATLDGSLVGSGVNWSATIAGSACASPSYSYSAPAWSISCTAPAIETLNNTLVVQATYGNYTASATKPNSIIYSDTTPPQINITAASQYRGTNVPIQILVADNAGVSNVTANLTHPNGSVYSLSLSYSDPYYINSTATGSSDYGTYTIRVRANDTSGLNSTNSSTFNVFRGGYIAGNFTSPNGTVNTVEVKLFDSAGNLFYAFNATGVFNASVNATDLVSLQLSAFGQTATLHGVNISNNVSDVFRIDSISPFYIGAGALKAMTVSNVSTNYTNGTMTLDYSGTSYASESNVGIFKCSTWNFNTRTCTSGWERMSSSSLSVDRLNHKITANISSFSAYVAAEYICGDSVCHSSYGESSSVCAADCPITTQTVSVSGGGGGGGGGASSGGNEAQLREIQTQIERLQDMSPGSDEFQKQVDLIQELYKNLSSQLKDGANLSSQGLQTVTNSIYFELYPGEETTTSTTIRNSLSTPSTVSVSILGNIRPFVAPALESVALQPNSETELTLYVSLPADSKPGVYYGTVELKSDGGGAIQIPFNLRILQQKDRLLDLKIQPLDSVVEPGGTVRIETNIYNLGEARRVDAQLVLELIEQQENKILAKAEEALAIETSLSTVKSMQVPGDIPEGKYVLRATATYPVSTGQTREATSVDTITVRRTLVPMYLMLFAILLAGGGYILWKRREKEKKRFAVKIDFSKLPQFDSRAAFIGKIAETNVRAAFPVDRLVMHALVAGASGSGKTVAAQVIVEEVLKKKVAVVVFDPTAQWTGFLRKNTTKEMLDLYPNFGMQKTEAMAFPGNIYRMSDPSQPINLKELMKPGEISVFTLANFKSTDIEILVSNTIEQVFAMNLEEAKELKLLIVFDEVHRLLPKFGGTGKGFTNIERAVREFRKWGVGMLLSSQVLSDFVGEIKTNISTEIQLRTKYEEDLNRIKLKYGEDILKYIVKSPIGTGMVQNAEYNKGNPYFVSFRPLLHSIVRLSDKALEQYQKYNERIGKIVSGIDELKAKEVDVFDVELELKLARDKLNKGSFEVVEIYLESLEKKVDEMKKGKR